MTMSPSTAPARSELIGPGRLVLVVGPSGAGKDTVIAGAKAACAADSTFVFPRRVVTRPASDAEDHDTLEDAEFKRAVGKRMFAFWWEAHGHKYAIPRAAENEIRAGRVVISNVSRGIVAQMREKYASVDAVLITAPTAILAVRLGRRTRETDGSVIDRIKRNDAFDGFRPDHVIETTGAPEDAVRRLLDVIRGSTARLSP